MRAPPVLEIEAQAVLQCAHRLCLDFEHAARELEEVLGVGERVGL